MAATPCFTDFKETVKDLMSESDAKALADLIKERAEARRVKRLEPKAEALNKSVEELISELDAQAKLKQIEYRHNALKHQNSDDFMEPFEKDWTKGLAAYYHGIEGNKAGSRLSVSSNIHSRVNDVFSYLNMKLTKAGVSHIFNNRKYDRLNALARAGVKVADPNAMKVGEAVRDTYRYAAKLANMHGANISDQGIEDYIARTTHNIEKMQSPTGSSLGDFALRNRLRLKYRGDYQKIMQDFKERAFQRWHKTIRPLTDNERTLSHVATGDEDKFFRSFYDAVIGGIRKTPYDDEGNPVLTGLRRSFNLAEKLRAERVWHPKDPDSWLTYNKEYGLHSFHDASIVQLENLGRSIGMMERMGTNPRAFANRFISKYEKLARDQNIVGAKRRIKQAKQFVEFSLGDLTQPMLGLGGKIMAGVRMVPLFRLGALAVRSQPDINVVASALRQYNMPYLSTVGRAYKDFFKGFSDPERKELAIRLGLYSEGTFLNLLTRWGNIDTPRGIFARMLQWQDKYSGINRFDNANRYTVGSMIAHKLGALLDQKLDDLKPNIKTMLGRYGIDNKRWELIKTAKGQLFKTKFGKFLTPDVAHDISDEDIATRFYGNKIPKVSADKALAARQDIYGKLLNLYQDQSLYGKTLPTISDRSLMQLGSKMNSFPGQLWKTVLLFRSFAFANIRRTFMRFMFSGGAENMYDALVRGKADYKGLAKYIAGGLPFGYMSYTAGRILNGEEPPDPTDPKTWLISLMGAGGAFIYGDLIEDFLDSKADIIKTFGGRGISMWTDIAQLIHAEIYGKGHTPASAFVRFVHKNLPLGNLFFIKPILDRAIFDQIQQQIDPMYKYKLERRLAKENIHMLHLGG